MPKRTKSLPPPRPRQRQHRSPPRRKQRLRDWLRRQTRTPSASRPSPTQMSSTSSLARWRCGASTSSALQRTAARLSLSLLRGRAKDQAWLSRLATLLPLGSLLGWDPGRAGSNFLFNRCSVQRAACSIYTHTPWIERSFISV